MKQFRIVKETRKKYDGTITKYFVEETANIPFIKWWRRWTTDKPYPFSGSIDIEFTSGESAMQAIQDWVKHLKKQYDYKHSLKKEVVQVITVDKDFNIEREN